MRGECGSEKGQQKIWRLKNAPKEPNIELGKKFKKVDHKKFRKRRGVGGWVRNKEKFQFSWNILKLPHEVGINTPGGIFLVVDKKMNMSLVTSPHKQMLSLHRQGITFKAKGVLRDGGIFRQGGFRHGEPEFYNFGYRLKLGASPPPENPPYLKNPPASPVAEIEIWGNPDIPVVWFFMIFSHSMGPN